MTKYRHSELPKSLNVGGKKSGVPKRMKAESYNEYYTSIVKETLHSERCSVV